MSDNIRVAVRVRPLISRELKKDATTLWKVEGEKKIHQINSPSVSFCFDHVFGSLEDNETVYEKICSPIVKYIMQGFNGTIFAYGQTSSGKTYTMMGSENESMLGVLHHTISEIFSCIQKMPEREFLLRVSFMEIYNEKISDLLSKGNENLKIQEDKDGLIKVNGLNETIVQTAKKVLKLMKTGERNRRTGETLLNQKSSRSHSIFRMIIESRMRDVEDAAVNVSQLNLVDLAGSERVDQAGTTGERFKESVHINTSLFKLSQVISQLSEHEDHYVNFRDSKLTRLLQNSLGGNALTAIICTVTPASLEETLSTLKFASRAKNIKNKPQVNEIINDQALIKRYENDLKLLTEKLEVSKMQNKELEEEKKQNENLKRQIEELKSKFISQLVRGNEITIPKATRRETWGGHLDRNRFKISLFPPRTSASHLTTLEEETDADQDYEIENEYSILKVTQDSHSFSSGRYSSGLQKLEDTAVQTDHSCNTEGIAVQVDFPKSKKINFSETSIDVQVQTDFSEIEDSKTEILLKNKNIMQINNVAFKTSFKNSHVTTDLCAKSEDKKIRTDSVEIKDIVQTDFFLKSKDSAVPICCKEFIDVLTQTDACQETDILSKTFSKTRDAIVQTEELEETKIVIHQDADQGVSDENKSNSMKNIDSQNNCQCGLSEKYETVLLKLNKLQHEHSELEEFTNLERQITYDDLKLLVENFEQKLKYITEAHNKKIIELESNYKSEMIDQEMKFHEDMSAKIFELKKKHLEETFEKNNNFRKEIQELEVCKKQMRIKYENMILESDRNVQKAKREAAEKEQEMLTMKTNFALQISDCKKVYDCLKDKYLANKCELAQKTEELENLRKTIAVNSNVKVSNIEQLQSKLNNVMHEKDSVSKKYSMLKTKFIDMTDNVKEKKQLLEKDLQQKKDLQQLKFELDELKKGIDQKIKVELEKKENEFEKEKSKLYEHSEVQLKELKNEMKVLDETNKKLLLELDQEKAKSTSLKLNNSKLVKEIEKLKELSKFDCTPEREKASQNSMKSTLSDHKRSTEKRNTQFLVDDQVVKTEYNQGIPETSKQEKHSLESGCGAVGMVKLYFQEQELKKKDKEIAKLKVELNKQRSCSAQKPQSVITSKIDTDANQMFGVYDTEQTATLCSNALHPYPPGVIPEIKPKRILKEKISNDGMAFARSTKENCFEVVGEDLKLSQAAKENVLRYLSNESEVPACKQQ